MVMAGDLAWFWGVAACVKILLAPAYRSTDFEVHRHWLALTSSLPISQWYTDTSSQWTLDYPPLFAYFELLLSIPASIVDPAIADVANLNYNAQSVVVFQRISVVFADLLLLIGVGLISRRFTVLQRRIIYLLILWSPALIIVDHIHFQYNGFLLGILLLSLGLILEGRDVCGGIVFAVLICFKHLFAVAAPVYFVYLLRHYCNGHGLWRNSGRFLKMGAVVSGVAAVSFGPFFYHGQMKQVFHRLFPFGRGICHAYWAPNFWALYIMLDKFIASFLRKLGYPIMVPSASFTSGLVGLSSPFAVLPQVTPAISLALVLLAMSPCLVKAWRTPEPRLMLRWVSYAYTCGFIFGWHVHEKASLHFLIPLAVTAVNSMEDARHYFFLATVSCYSIFPLLFGPAEYPVKLLLLAVHSILVLWSFPMVVGRVKGEALSVYAILGKARSCFLMGLAGLEIWNQLLHPLILGPRLPFLPLMLVSVYCAVGMVYSWAWQLRRILLPTDADSGTHAADMAC
ncbi:ALG6, ALG8 glycosyltransferase family [Wolffia australiana]